MRRHKISENLNLSSRMYFLLEASLDIFTSFLQWTESRTNFTKFRIRRGSAYKRVLSARQLWRSIRIHGRMQLNLLRETQTFKEIHFFLLVDFQNILFSVVYYQSDIWIFYFEHWAQEKLMGQTILLFIQYMNCFIAEL